LEGLPLIFCGGWTTILKLISRRQFTSMTLHHWRICPDSTSTACSGWCAGARPTAGLPDEGSAAPGNFYALKHRLQTLRSIAAFRARAILPASFARRQVERPHNFASLFTVRDAIQRFARHSDGPMKMIIGVGSAKALMQLFRTFHPPARANPFYHVYV